MNIEYIPDKTWVEAKRSKGIRFISKQTSKYTFEDDGKLSKQSPSPRCYYKNYQPIFKNL